MVSRGDTLSSGDTLSLVQAQGGVLLEQLKGASGITSGVLLQLVDGSGTVNATHDMNGNITAKTVTVADAVGNFSGTLTGAKAHIISGAGATRTLLATESGSTVLFDRAAGIVYTLPAPAVGLYFDFIVTTTITSNSAEIDTDAGTTFLLGNVNSQIDATATDKAFFGNGSSHVKVQMNGTTTGGIKGTQLRLTCVTTTIWQVTGMVAASGTLATIFA